MFAKLVGPKTAGVGDGVVVGVEVSVGVTVTVAVSVGGTGVKVVVAGIAVSLGKRDSVWVGVFVPHEANSTSSTRLKIRRIFILFSIM